MKKKFILPRKWILRVNNINQISSYLIEKYGKIDEWITSTNASSYWLYSDAAFSSIPNYISTVWTSGYVEITLKQFEQYVLKIKPVKTKKEDMKYLIPIFKKYGIT